jgi:hypothetical protein
VSFWYLSIAGAVVLLVYALHRRDPVFVAGQVLGVAIYLRNLQLIRRSAQGDAGRGPQAGAAAGHDGGAGRDGDVDVLACGPVTRGRTPDSDA